jgi:hypothetical protein
MIRVISETCRRLRRLHQCAAGQMTLEWALVLVVFALPMYYVCAALLEVLVAHYRMVTFLETLPFP